MAAMNNGFPSQETARRVREAYLSAGLRSPGCRVELISMGNPYTRLKPGNQGTVNHVDDIGTVFVSLDCGSHLGAVYGEDYVVHHITRTASIKSPNRNRA